MGETRHHRIGLGERAFGQRELQIGELRVERVDLVADVETEIRRHLIIARARRMQAPGCGADQFRQTRLDIHVDVFERARENEFAAVDLGLDLLQPLRNLRGVVAGDNPAFGEHGDMRERATNVLRAKTLVKIDRDVDGFQNRVGCALKAPAPYLARHFFPGACAR